MTEHKIAALLLAAGQGTRMKSSLPKVMHRLAGRPMILHALATLESLLIDEKFVVVGSGMEQIGAAIAPVATILQQERLGTAHAVAQARGHLSDQDTVLILYGDTPLLQAATIYRLLQMRRDDPELAVVVLAFRTDAPTGYGRLLAGEGGLLGIVEEKDASPEQRAITLCNSGVMAIDGSKLFELIERIGNDNAQGEFYLTDIVSVAVARGLRADYVLADREELQGINSRAELAAAEAILQKRLRSRAMEKGATLIDPASVFFSADTEIGQDVEIGPQVIFGPGVRIEDGVEIRPFCHLEGVSIAKGAVIGPFARLRPGAVIEAGAHIGNFVEIKNAVIESGAKVNHLTYVGDARVGARANLGAGTITCNYDGFGKYPTVIGEGAFIGSNSALVAPVTIGKGAIIGAGSVITKDVAIGALAVSRGSQMELPGWADRFRERKQEEAAQNKVKKG